MLLAIDTCGALGGVALGYPAEPGLWFRELAGKTFSEQLLSTIAELLRDAGVQVDQLTGVIVVHGPGSFTGIRIGVSAAKGLAEALEIPVIAISRLELLARKSSDGSAAAILDAGRGEFFAGFYRFGVAEAELLLTAESLRLAIADSQLPVLACEQRVFDSLPDLAPKMVAAPDAADALRVGGERFRAGIFDDVATLDANYLRRSETEMLARIAEHAALRAAASTEP